MNTVIELLNTWGGHFIHFAWPVFWQSSALIVVLFGLDVLLRRRVRAVVVYALWMLLLVKLILPASLSLPTGLGYWVITSTPPAINSQPTKVVHPAGDIGVPAALRETPAISPTVTSIGSMVPTVANQSAASLRLPGLVLLGWFLGVAVLMVAMFLRLRITRQFVRQAMPADLTIRSILHECRRQMGVRQIVDVRITRSVPMPVVCGLIRPVILLPGSLMNGLAAEQLKAVFFHELAHVRRGDLWVSHLQTILQVIHFYNPMLWLANAAIRRVREQAADEAVLVALADDAVVYPETLLNVAKLISAQPRLAFGLVGIFESKSKLAERIRLMLGRPFPRSSGLGFGAAIMLLILSVILLPMSGPAGPDDTSQLVTRNFEFDRELLSHQLDRLVSEKTLSKDADLATKLKAYLRRAGVDLAAPKSLSCLDEIGLLSVQATSKDLENIGQVLNALRGTRVERRNANWKGIVRRLAEVDKQIQVTGIELSDLRRSLGILELRDGNGVRTEGFTSAETFQTLERQRIEAEGNYNRFNTVYSQLITNSIVDIPFALAHLFPDPGLIKLLDTQALAQQQLAGKQQDLSESHPDYKNALAMTAKVDKQISEKVKGLMIGLKIQIDGYRAQMDLLSKRIEMARAEQNEWTRRAQPYFDRLRDLEDLQKVRSTLKLRLEEAEVETAEK